MSTEDLSARWVYITCTDKKEARHIASAAVKERLAACGNIIDKMESVYEWKGEIESDEETVLILKTMDDRYQELEQLVLSMHSYECPCIIALPVEVGLDGYLKWIHKETRS